MPDAPNPWLRPPASSSGTPTPLPVRSRLMRGFHWLGVAAITVGAPLQIGGDLLPLLTHEAAVARVLAAEEPGGRPDSSQLPPPLSGRINRIGLRFTTIDGREVTTSVVDWSLPLRHRSADTELPVRYDPSDPAVGLSFRGMSEIWSYAIPTLLIYWWVLSYGLRVARGGSASSLRTAWPPLPFGR